MEGLSISRCEFASLSRDKKDLVVFDNLQHIRMQLSTYKTTKKVQYAWLTAITSIMGWFIGSLINK